MREFYFNGEHLTETSTTLTPTNGRKSFYGKCSMFKDEHNTLYLLSYNTIVCKYNNGVFTRLWDGYSETTKNHVNGFRAFLGLGTINKSDWVSMEV